MPYAINFSLNLGSGSTGLTLLAQLVDTDGDDVGDEITTGFVEIGGGHYGWFSAAIPDAFRGAVKFYTSGQAAAPLLVGAINPEDLPLDSDAIAAAVLDADTTDHDDAGTVGAAILSLGALPSIILSGEPITVLSPVIPDIDSERITLYAGDSYVAALSRQLTWRFSDAAVEADDIASVRLDAITATGTSLDIAGVAGAATQDGDDLVVSFDLVTNATKSLKGQYIASIVATTTSGRVVTLARPRFDIRQRLWTDSE